VITGDRYHGLIIVDKPAGWTSHDVVARIRKLTGQRSVGHAGTLDPAATGVLPVAVGLGTRALEYLASASKTYLAEVTFGIETDSLDIDGRVTRTGPAAQLTLPEIEVLLQRFTGTFYQVPPLISAIKVDGERLYRRARAGHQVRVAPRLVTVDELRVLKWDSAVLELCINCSKGFYVRSLAQDLGAAAGVPAYLSNLVRARVGPFLLNEAWTLAELEAAPLDQEWEKIALHPDASTSMIPAAIIDQKMSLAWNRGHSMSLAARRTVTATRVYDNRGKWLGIGELNERQNAIVLKPRKVVAEST
jgi:tRNA pseudouridine55 synthase